MTTAATSVGDASPSVAPPTLVALPAAVAALAAEHVSGAMALFDTRTGQLSCSEPARCQRGYLPGATFELVTSAVALENGVLDDAESAVPSDGKGHDNPDWNHGHTLRSALQVSCLPCFQGLARTVGEAPLRAWLTRASYGNQQGGGPVETLGLSGELSISPLQQVDFLRRLDGGQLPLQPRTLDVLREVLTLDVGSDYILRGKIAFSAPPEQTADIGWFIGDVELGEQRAFFATVVDGHSGDVDLKVVQRRVTERVLRELRLLP